jgi:hypothetical protein
MKIGNKMKELHSSNANKPKCGLKMHKVKAS